MFEIIPFTHRGRVSAYNPFKELDELQRSFFGDPFFTRGGTPPFRTDIRETDAEYVLEADLPGFDKKDIRLEVQDDTLTITAERRSAHENEDEKKQYVRCERSYGSYTRSFDISGVDADAIKARYENGVLTLTMPKKAPVVPEAKTLSID